ncbi:MAG TPA: hypothetical protein VL359_06695, partial [bacterium]|nr:hypothetical protein [bacterium]
PFIGIGSGNYYVKYVQQQAGVSFLDSASGVFSYRGGFRLLMGRLGLLVETGQTLATLHLDAEGTPATLELGGYFTNVGLSWLF